MWASCGAAARARALREAFRFHANTKIKFAEIVLDANGRPLPKAVYAKLAERHAQRHARAARPQCFRVLLRSLRKPYPA